MVLVGAIVRIAIPYALRPWIVSEVDAALVGRIALEGLDLSLLRGGVTLHGLEVHVDELPSPAAEGEAEAEAPPPVFEAERLEVEISWLALLVKMIRIERFDLEGFTVRLDRKEDGLLLPEPVPSDEPPDPDSDPEPETEVPGGWSYAADDVAMRDGRIYFHDFTLGDEPERFDLEVTEIAARRLALVIDPTGYEPARLVTQVRLGEGSLGLDATITSRAEGISALSKITLENLPIAGVRVYLTLFGWSDLVGRLDAVIEHRFETDGAHDLSGTASLSDIVVSVPELDRPALEWKKLGVEIETVDLVKQHVSVTDALLEGARLLVDPKAEPPVRVIARPAGARPEESADEPSSPWTWRVAKARIADSRIDLLGAEKPLPVSLVAESRDLNSASVGPSTLKLTLNTGEGSLGFDGALGLSPFVLDGKLRIEDLVLPPLLERLDAPGLELVREGTLRADLQVVLAPGVASPGGSQPLDLRADGTLGLAGVDVGEAKTVNAFWAKWKDLEAGIGELKAPGLFGASDSDAPREIFVNLDRLRLLQPDFLLTRTPTGILLPSIESDPAEPAEDTAPGPEIRIALAQAVIEAGHLQIIDQTVEPVFRSRIDTIDATARGIRWPGLVVQDGVLAMKGLHGATLDVSGGFGSPDSMLKVKLAELPLAPFNAYLKERGYVLSDGKIALKTTAKVRSESYETSNKIVVSALDIGGAGGESFFQENFGIPLSVALGLLTDLKGNITLTVPVASKRSGTKIGFTSVVGQALRKALVGTLASPLKLFGAVLTDGKFGRPAPEPIAFEPGMAEISEAGGARIEQLANLLSTRPELALTLSGATAAEDLRWLRELALLDELRATAGVRALGSLGEIGIRAAVRDHLEARFAGEDTPLEPEARSWLEAQVGQKTIESETLLALAEARAAAAQQALVTEYRIDPLRLSLGPPASEASSASPGVTIALGALSKASP